MHTYNYAGHQICRCGSIHSRYIYAAVMTNRDALRQHIKGGLL